MALIALGEKKKRKKRGAGRRGEVALCAVRRQPREEREAREAMENKRVDIPGETDLGGGGQDVPQPL